MLCGSVVYEKRLIEQYINENGTEPGSSDELSTEDLLPLQSSRIVRPRPPTLTSIPALLATFQNEWDSLALETYNLKEQLSRTREELATALYQHDAAIRVIARLTKERDEAREALGKVTVTDNGANGDSMAVDTVEGLPEDFATAVDETHAKLSQGRRKRPVPEGWATADVLSTFEPRTTNALPVPQATSLDTRGTTAAIGGLKGDLAMYLFDSDKLGQQLSVGEPVTASLTTEIGVVCATAQGSVKVYQGDSLTAEASEHAGPATGLSLHPAGQILASVGSDKSIVFYDLASTKRISRAYTDSRSVSGKIKLFMTKTLEQAAEFDIGAPVQALVFSENGFWLAATAKGQTTVTVFDLRKEGAAATAKILETGGAVQSLSWDYTGQFLATGGPSGATVQQYAKSSKKWSEPFRSSVPAVAISWGPSAQKLVSVNGEGVVTVFGVKE
ncbi:pre-mRNA-processing factor 19 [Geosmithia morbida]|uniref:Pre-mRNA-processing factor 19 n=1 Tax=Geosmithia morbida TaxID=1094350 RepID=A0A9P4YNR4_9HYPO|nr:pre-mRNA-processing factor 19 [Geosmithia morbida]KAF4119817.1 pre-mRNA-processing factor 19 [Geosmithia morbida]